jgi:hypothetical protein
MHTKRSYVQNLTPRRRIGCVGDRLGYISVALQVDWAGLIWPAEILQGKWAQGAPRSHREVSRAFVYLRETVSAQQAPVARLRALGVSLEVLSATFAHITFTIPFRPHNRHNWRAIRCLQYQHFRTKRDTRPPAISLMSTPRGALRKRRKTSRFLKYHRTTSSRTPF